MNWQVGLNFYSKKAVIFDLVNIEEKYLANILQEWKCHIYLICKRKKIYFESLQSKEDGRQVIELYTLSPKHDKEKFTKEIPFDIFIYKYENGLFEIDTSEEKNVFVRDFILYNHLYLIEKDPIGETVTNPLPTDLEVAYVGQAFGRNADRTIDYRLVNHEKVQKIAIEIINKGSNEELLVIGINVDTNDITTGLSLLSSDAASFNKEKFYELIATAKQKIAEGQKITIFEASVIKYFKPALNKEYKETFPSQDFASYKEIYDTNFNYISLTIDTFTIRARLYSNENPLRKYLHHSAHSLTTNEEKKSLFKFLMEEAKK